MTTIKLTKEENKFWLDAFNYWKENYLSDLEADKRVFNELKRKFPRIKKLAEKYGENLKIK